MSGFLQLESEHYTCTVLPVDPPLHTQGMMCSAHAVQIKLESRRILEKAFAEYPVRPDVVLLCYHALIIILL